MDDRLQQNKQTVMAFYDLMFNACRPAEALERYAGAVYTQHDPMVADGKQGIYRILREGGLRVSRQACRVSSISQIPIYSILVRLV